MNPSDETRGLKLALAVYVLVFALKLVVYLLTGVMALLAEALHTLSDIFVSGFLLLAARWSLRQADETHMFGYGRAQNVAALVAATLFISFTSFELYREAIPRLFSLAETSYQNLGLAVAVLLLSMLIATAPLVTLFRQKQRGAAAKAQLMELFNDELGLLAALVGTLFIQWGQPIADPLASIVVATIIAVNALRLFRENSSLLLGRSPGPAYLADMERRARSVPGVLGIHDLRAEYIGPDTVHAGMHVEVQRGTLIQDADSIAERVHEQIHRDRETGFCVIKVEAASPSRAAINRAQERSAFEASAPPLFGAPEPNPSRTGGGIQ